MPKGTKAKKSKNISNGKKKEKVTGSGIYGMAGLAKAVAGAVAAKLASNVPKGTFEKQGAAIGRGLSKFTGFGDYVMNDIVSTRPVKQAGTAVQTVSNCEYIKDILAPGNANFTLEEFLCNASSSTFPWANSLGKLYTKFRFKQLLFEFRTMSSDYSSNVGLGAVIMAPIYNINQANFVTKQQMEAASHAVSFKPSNSSVCGIECASTDQNIKWYNVRSGDMETTPFTDPLRFTLAVAGCPAAAGTVLGELWVHYTMEFIEPILTAQSMASSLVIGAGRTFSTTAGIVNNSFGGLATGFTNNVIPSLPTTWTSANIGVFSGKPTGNYYVGIDSTARRLWFERPGRYVVTWNCAFTVAPTGTPTTVLLYDAAIGVGTGSVVASAGQANFTGYDKKVWAATYYVITNSVDTSVDFTLQSALGGFASVTIEGTTCGSQIQVVRYLA